LSKKKLKMAKKKKALDAVSPLGLMAIYKNKGITTTHVAKSIGVNRSNLSNYLNNDYLPPNFHKKLINYISDNNLY